MVQAVGHTGRRMWLARAAVVALAACAACARGHVELVPRERDAATRQTTIAAPEFGTSIGVARAIVDSIRLARTYPGVSVAVGVGNRMVWREATGLADIDGGVPVQPASQFPIGSVSKPLTSAVVMRLAARGVIDLDRDVRTYVPAFPEKPHPVTSRQLLSHQGGIRHYRIMLTQRGFTESNLNRAFASVTASLAIFADDKLKFVPDEDFLYSTLGYTLLSAVVEGATKQPFLEVMRAELFSPFGLTDTEADDRTRAHPRRTRDYRATRTQGKVRRAPETNSSYKWAGGGLLSTPADLVQFGMALLDGRVVPDSVRSVMFTPRRLASGAENPQRYGLGWRIGALRPPADTSRRVSIAHHGGTAVGSESALLLVPEFGIVVALAGNANTGGSDGLIGAAARIAREFMPRAR